MNLLKSTGTFGFYTIISRLLGYLRDILIAIFLGTGMLADAFFVAFRIPNTFRRLFAEGTFNAAFVPSYSSEITKGKKQSNKFANNIFKHLGRVLEIRDEKLSYKFWSTASLMAAYYEILNSCSKWLVRKGINKKTADSYVAELFLALSQDALNKSSQGYKKLVADSQTPKGLNMQVLNELKKGKFFTKFTKALENVNKRVSK